MKIIQLEYFCAVSRYHSITQAAQKLYVTQPAISSAIRELEKEFSISLFTRTKNHMTLTKEGEVFYQKASELLNTINQTSSELLDLGRKVTPIRIGIPPLLSTIFFPDMLIAFQKEYPDIPVELLEYGSIRAASLVQEDILDLALVNMNFYEIDKLNSYQILSDQIVFCVSFEHHLAKEKEVSIGMVKDEPLIMYNTDSVQNTTLNSLFESIGVKPNVILQASQLYTIQNFIKNNLGGAFLYSSILKNMPDLASIPVSPAIRQEIGLVWKKGKYINSSVEKYISFTRKYAADMRYVK
ncbi:LysR family transcriptional regulator [Faecalicatena orotica]|uniref:DNA-binding transcriptional LysR family regulator n=1 Tax=Faecalicatena orotica TaxID=1544 RepID=A0A2Y9BG31_9FIRM|nr:LysR family transcriptional regulator [Faecalicatena orotica]PWJ28626.1 DNA-binding transcriptional LysR family regulator [Faecalicatena orotica]SSA56447.1 DNA-binding transcriptional regulator, LysR family [Faecalicatena orotica]